MGNVSKECKRKKIDASQQIKYSVKINPSVKIL